MYYYFNLFRFHTKQPFSFNHLKALEQSKSGKSFDETKAEQEAKEAEKLKEIAKAEQNKKEAKKLEDVVSKITDFIKENKSNMDKIKPIIEKSKELGYDNPTLITDIDDANKVLALIS